MIKRIYAVLLVIAMTVLTSVSALHEVDLTKNPDEVESVFHSDEEELVVWYTDDALTDYLKGAAYKYYEETGVHIVPTLVSGVQYLENIHETQLENEALAPDLYIVSNDTFEKAYLSGLATEINDVRHVVDKEHFTDAAFHAITYKNKELGYPLYFETSVLLLNKTYLENAAAAAVEAEKDALEGAAAQENADTASNEELAANNTELTEEQQASVDGQEGIDALPVEEDQPVVDEAVWAKEDELTPQNLEGILTFADSYDAPENVEAVFRWDVSDIFYNYFIVGDSICIGGENGDDSFQFDVYNQKSVDCLTLYQKLNQFFSIDTKSVTYDSVMDDFMNGRIVFTVATTDAISKLEKAKADGTFAYDYKVTAIPQVSDSLASRSLSVTYAAAINGFSEQTDLANDFAGFLVENQGEEFYHMTGKISTRNDLLYENEAIYGALDEYALSIPVTKMMEQSALWAKLEVVFSKIWHGADVNETLAELAGTENQQISANTVEFVNAEN